ncbi:D-alanine--D-alanine ligase Ddl [Planctomycetes bacterium Pan216]|uniref:D-alanine--D-alanine ligase n=1 Tax=Kolteria novifilia TaxID=2527975 RepID=A0A518BAF1_9BACT|nr:D-alanine--D-alanine ligase Ddl [Planctomycetes bacterium Pan216]
MLRVMVLRGGPSAEREISLKSGAAVAEACRALGHQTSEADIDPNDLSALDVPTDVIFPALHGFFGEDGQLQSLMESRGLCFVGSGSEACERTIDKISAKRIWRECGLPTSPWREVTPENLDELAGILTPPFVIKPVDQGSSLGVRVVKESGDALEALGQALESWPRVMVEPYLRGRELTVGFLGEGLLPIIEIVPATETFGYDAKYVDQRTRYVVQPGLSSPVRELIEEIASIAFASVGIRQLGRLDLILDERHGPMLLELNAIPGMTERSLVPMAARHVGLHFVEVIEQLLDHATRRHAGLAEVAT